MELVEVLKHQGKPRTELFVDIPSPYGGLRLDILGTAEAAFNQTSITSLEVWVADKLLEEARAKGPEDGVGAESILLDLACRYPYYEDVYLNLFYLYDAIGNEQEAEYHLKQAIALGPSDRKLAMLGNFLGKNKRHDEEVVVQRHLREARMQVPETGA